MSSQQQPQSASSGSAGAWGTSHRPQQSSTIGWEAATGGGGGSNGGRGGSGQFENANLGPVPSQVRGSDSFGLQRYSPTGPQGASSNGPQRNSAWNTANSNQSSTGWGTGTNDAPTPAPASAWTSTPPQANTDDAGRAAAWHQPQRKSSGPPASSYPDHGNGIQSRPTGYRGPPPQFQQQDYDVNNGGGSLRQQSGPPQFFGQGEGNSGDSWATGPSGQGSFGTQQRQRSGPPPSFTSSSRRGDEFGGSTGGAMGNWITGGDGNAGYGSRDAFGGQDGGRAPGPRRYVPTPSEGPKGYGGPAYGGFGGEENAGGRASFRDVPRSYDGPFIADMPHINWEKERLPEFHKDFYTEHENVRNRPMEEVEEWRRQKDILVEGEACKPVTSWIEAMLPDYIGDYIKEKHFVEPTPIQCQALPIACGGGDLVAISETGSGKTLAYAIPACMHVNAQEPTEQTPGPIALVLAPTRELAMQILDDFKGVGGSTDIKSVAVFGGVSRAHQRSAIGNGAFDVLIATPGRLIDMVCSGDIQLKRVTYLVIDEADRMINEGFEDELRQIISCVRKDRQVLMFSATWPSEVRNLAEEYLKSAVRITVGKDEIVAAHSIKQEVFVCHGYREKLHKLVDLLEEVKIDKGRVLVFANSKSSVAELVEELREHPNKYQALGLHGNLPQEERDFALGEFRSGTHPVLLATDLAQRGLDIPSVTLVVNFDAPNEITSYVHRIGRTGRAGHTGRAITFLSSSRDYQIAPQIKRVISESQQQITPEFEEYLAESGTSDSFADSFATDVEHAEPPSSSAPASWGPKTESAEPAAATTAPASGTWGSSSTAHEDSASVPSWNVAAQHFDSTQSVAGSSVAESDLTTQLTQADESEEFDKSYDSGHGESRIEQGVKAVKITDSEEGDSVTGEGAKSTDGAEEPRDQKSDDDWIKELLASTPIAEQGRLEEDGLALPAESVKTQIDDGTERESGSGAVTPVAGRPRSPISYADIA